MKRFCFCLLFYASIVSAQVHEDIDVNVVNVYLSATDTKGRFVTDLKPDDLILKEDGVDQNITYFSNFANEKSDKLGEKDVPLTIAFVMDVSESMNQRVTDQQKIDIVKNAALRVLDELKPDDRMELIAFNQTPKEVEPLTPDKKKFTQELLFQDVEGGNTALLDSIYFAQDKLRGEFGRKILVVCSDGDDTSSYLRFDEVLSNVIASDVTILSFGTMNLTSGSIKGHYVMQKMAEASGGYAFFPTSLNQLNQVMDQLRQAMRSQYSIGYRPIKPMDGSWHKIEIACKRPELKLRYRQGYFAK
ncbi:MAG TPA: VWA domain-containing protein [Acidobacteriota bacterium]|nr:VWA domain-containing protein [Acidobacteriota bacterium]